MPHGFRSSFRDWCGETGQPRELAEQALAHIVRNKVEAAYARSDCVHNADAPTLIYIWPVAPLLLQPALRHLLDEHPICMPCNNTCDHYVSGPHSTPNMRYIVLCRSSSQSISAAFSAIMKSTCSLLWAGRRCIALRASGSKNLWR